MSIAAAHDAVPAVAVKKELSGLFTDPARFSQQLAELCQPAVSPDALITHLRLFHHEPPQTAALLQALAHCPPGGRLAALQHLDLYELDSGEGGRALKDFLVSAAGPTSRPSSLAIQSCQGGVPAAALLGEGLAAPACRVHELSLAGFSEPQLSAALGPLAATREPRLTRLTLTRCTLGASAAAWLPALRRVAHLELRECVFTDPLAALIVSQGLLTATSGGEAVAPAVRTLVLDGGRAGVETARAVASLLAHPGCALERLSLDNNGGLGDGGAAELAAGLARNRTLRALQLGHCDVGPRGCDALAGVLAAHPALRVLALDYNHVGSQGLLALLNAICGPVPPGAPARPTDANADDADLAPAEGYTGPPLQRLQLEGNWLRGSELVGWSPGSSPRSSAPGQGGDAALASHDAADPPPGQQAGGGGRAAQREMQSHVRAPLRTLLLARNHLSDAGVRLLQSALAHVPGSLEQLDLSGNAVGPEGAEALVELLRAHPGLQELKLDNNRLHDAGAQALLAAASRHPALRVLRAEQCRVNLPEVKAQLALLQQQLAARATQLRLRQQQQQQQQRRDASAAAAPARRPHRVGTRFPAHVYAVAPAMDDEEEEDGAAAELQRQRVEDDAARAVAAAAAEEEPQPQPARRVRAGSRFPAHVYAVPMAVDEEEEEEEGGPAPPQPEGGGGAVAEGVELSPRGMAAPGFGSGMMEVDGGGSTHVPGSTAHKRLHTASCAAGRPGTPAAASGAHARDAGTPSTTALHPFRAWQQQHHHHQGGRGGAAAGEVDGRAWVALEAGGAAAAGGGDGARGAWTPAAATGAYPERYSVDLPWAVRPPAALAPASPLAPRAATRSVDLDHRDGASAGAAAVAPAGWPQHHAPLHGSASAQPGGAAARGHGGSGVAHAHSVGAAPSSSSSARAQHAQHAQHFHQYLVARPSGSGRRWVKPLTPEQQALFDVF